MADLKALIKQGEGISCVRKLMKYGKAYGGSDPELLEDDITKPNDKPTSGEDKKYEKKQCGN